MDIRGLLNEIRSIGNQLDHLDELIVSEFRDELIRKSIIDEKTQAKILDSELAGRILKLCYKLKSSKGLGKTTHTECRKSIDAIDDLEV